MSLAMYVNNFVPLNGNLSNDNIIIPTSNYYSNKVIVSDVNYNNQDLHRSRQRTQRKKRRRTRFSQIQKNALESSFAESMYPSKKMQLELAELLRLAQKTVKIWFQNRRAKFRKYNNARKKVKLDKNTLDAHENVTHRYDGYCPTCLLPVHYRCYQDGRWTYCRLQHNDSTNDRSKIDELQSSHNNSNPQSTHDMDNKVDDKVDDKEDDNFKKEEGYQSEDFDTVLNSVEELIK